MKKYEDKKYNIIANLIEKYKESKKISKVEVCMQLLLHDVYIDYTELKRMEEGKMIIKDFEIGFGKVLD